jgi:hypothetical protein
MEHLTNHFTFLAARRQGATVAEGRAGLVVDSGLDCDTFNVVVSDEAGMDLSAIEARAIASTFDGRSFSWWVGPRAPLRVHSRLHEIGLSPGAPEPGMSLDLELAHRGEPCGLEGLSIERVQRPEQVSPMPMFWHPIGGRLMHG